MGHCASKRGVKARLRVRRQFRVLRLPPTRALASGLEIDARLVVSFNGDDIQIAGSGSYLIINFPSQRVFDTLTSGPPSSGPEKPKKPKGFDPLQQLNDLALELGLVLELRVAGKTHVTFGAGRSPKITFHAVLGKIGSFFRGD